ncbi:MAG: pyruvate ferredoxin oxidoreductase [Deltaproteobacteria bacterium]|jgi:pyruvate ferredoxin oxidoreductase alpha subunit|nr:pyruvate ferredoxin oxidoreductase [Deltaproteobacteria bacterium]
MSGTKEFISGNEAVALAVRLSRPEVIPAYPISPQTIVVERLSEYVDDGSLKAQFIRVESEHSAITAALGSSVMGARTFTATSSQGLLYMAEGMPFVSGGRYPVVMMNANRTIAVPWSIFCDHNDSLMLINSGWMQVYVEDAQEALDVTIQAFRIAEDPAVSAPIIVNLDGFVLTHTYELVDVPAQEQVDKFLPPYVTEHKMSLEKPVATCIGAGPDWQTEFRYKQHRDMAVNASAVIKKTDTEFKSIFGRSYGGLTEKYRCDDAEAVLVTLGSLSTTARTVVDAMRKDGHKVGLVKIRFMRPFPLEDFVTLNDSVRAVGIIDKDISYGYEGVVFSNVNSALSRKSKMPLTKNYIGGLAGRDISKDNIRAMYMELLGLNADNAGDRVKFINLRWDENE